jgi:hypothetical protein
LTEFRRYCDHRHCGYATRQFAAARIRRTDAIRAGIVAMVKAASGM